MFGGRTDVTESRMGAGGWLSRGAGPRGSVGPPKHAQVARSTADADGTRSCIPAASNTPVGARLAAPCIADRRVVIDAAGGWGRVRPQLIPSAGRAGPAAGIRWLWRASLGVDLRVAFQRGRSEGLGAEDDWRGQGVLHMTTLFRVETVSRSVGGPVAVLSARQWWSQRFSWRCAGRRYVPRSRSGRYPSIPL